MSTIKEIQTRVKNKYDTKENFDKASFIPLKGEIVFYDIDGTLKNRKMKVGDGKTPIGELPFVIPTEQNVVLESDLYTYTPIGKISSASNTNPVKVASAGDPLKTVFNTVFGTQQDVQPTIGTPRLSVTQGTTSYTGGEYGRVHSATTDSVTFTLNNSASCNYGYRVGDTKTTGVRTVYYPVVRQNSADITITLPSGQTASSEMVASGTYVSHSNNVLYCNFDSDKKVSISISIPKGNTTTSSQDRYGTISANVALGSAQKENQLTTGTPITKFLTYLGNDATSSLSGGSATKSSTKYTISAGYVPYTYSLATSTPTSLPTSNRSQSKPSSITVSGGDSSTYLYIFVPSSASDITSIKSGGFGVPYTKVETSKSYAVNDGKTTTYKVFKTDSTVVANTFDIV